MPNEEEDGMPVIERGRFRNPMDEASIRDRILGRHYERPEVYNLAASAAGHQSAYTVDPLARKLRQRLPALLAELAAEVERENVDA